MSNRSASSEKKGILSQLVAMVKHILFHNGWLKLIAIIISLFLWAGLISQDETLTRDKTFQNVNVSVTGSETMKNNGYIVVDNPEDILSDVSIVAAVPQKQYEKAESSAYNVRLDLSRINGTGEQELKLQSTNSPTFGRVISTNPSSVTVHVEDYIVRQRIPVSVTVNGQIPEGWYMTTPTVDPALVAVSGPRSLVETISRARVFLDTEDLEWTEGTLYTSSRIVLYNRAGEEVHSNLLSVTSSNLTIDSVLIESMLYPTITFDTKPLVTISGNPARGYRIKETKVSPDTVTIAARKEVLDKLTELPMERTVKVNGLKETTVFQLKVQKPSEEAVISNDTVTVTVEIEPVEP